jgi:hypothetical protein
MLYQSILTLALGAISVLSSPTKRDFGPNTIYTPPSSYTNQKVLYARSLLLNDVSVHIGE